jgi:hypothetical protein
MKSLTNRLVLIGTGVALHFSLRFDPDKASPAALTKATADAGYPSTVHN